MSWITAGFLMFASSVVLYLLVRKSTLLKIPSQYNNLAMFAVPLVSYLVIALITKENLAITPYQFLIVFILSLFFSYLGNKFSLKSIEYAPNPGYSLILSKSYVVFTSIVAVFAFGSELSPQSILAIAFIVGFSPLIMIDKSKKINDKDENKNTNLKWIPLSFGAFFCWGLLSLTSKYLLQIGLGIIPRLVYSMTIVSLIISGEMYDINFPRPYGRGFSRFKL